MTDTPETAPAEKPRRGKGKGKKAGAAGEGKAQRPLTAMTIKKRGAALAKLEDKKKALKGRRRLLQNLLSGIADGSIGQPSKAAEAYLSLLPKKEAAEEAAAED